MQSTELINSKKPFINFRTQSSSRISGDEFSVNTNMFTPLKLKESGKKFNHKEYLSQQRSQDQDKHRLTVYGRHKFP